MDIGRILERMMNMDDATWARHSNPLSGWTRISILPLFALAIWSRIWFDWHALWVISLVVIWTWINPRLFDPPSSDHAWMTQGVLGERIWLARKKKPIPDHHAKVARFLNLTAIISIFILGYGLWKIDFGLTFAGLVIAMGSKLWFLDRMVWLKSEFDNNEYIQ